MLGSVAIPNTIIKNLRSKFQIDNDTAQSMRSAGVKGIIEAIDKYGEKYDPNNPDNISRTIYSQVAGRVRESFNKERASVMSAVNLPYQKVKHFKKFSQLYMQTIGDPEQMEKMHEQMGLKKQDVYSDLKGTEEGEQLLPMEGYTSEARKEAVIKKVKERDKRVDKEWDSFRGQIGLLRKRLQGEVTEEDMDIVKTGMRSIDKNIRSLGTMLNMAKKSQSNRGRGEFAKLRYEIGLLKEAKKKLQGSISPLGLKEYKVEYKNLLDEHDKRLGMIKDYYFEEIQRSNIPGFKSLYGFMEGIMGGYRPYELDKFVDEEQGGTTQEEVLDLGTTPSPEHQAQIGEQHAYNVSNLKTYLNFLPDFTRKVIQLHLGIDKHSPLRKTGEGIGEPAKRSIWGEPISSARAITKHLNQLVKEKKIPASVFGAKETSGTTDDHKAKIKSWKEKKPSPTKLVKRDKKQLQKEIKAYATRRKKARIEINKILAKNKKYTAAQKAKIREKVYNKHKANDKNVDHQPKVKTYVKKTKAVLAAEMKKWAANKPKQEIQGASREDKVNEQLKMAKKLISIAVPVKVVDSLIFTHRAVQSFNITKANLKDEIIKSVQFQAFFDAFNYNYNQTPNDSKDKHLERKPNAGMGIDFWVAGRKKNANGETPMELKTYYPTIDQLVTGISVVPESYQTVSTSQELENFLNTKNKA